MKKYKPQNQIPTIRKKCQVENILLLATIKLKQIYSHIDAKFSQNKYVPKRVLTQPNQPINQTNDNKNFDYIFYVHDLIENKKKNIQYIVEDLLGKGTFGQVLQCRNHKGIKLAMKVLKSRPAYISQGLLQAKILRQLLLLEKQSSQKQNFLKIYDAFMWNNHLCIVEEIMDNSFLNILQQSDYEGANIKWIEKWTKSLLYSLYQIHELGIIHCDIKPQNIMFRMNKSQQPVFIDFSSSCIESNQIFTYIQSRFYRAPEVIIGLKPFSSKIDIWSLGCVLIELYIGLPLFPGSNSYDQLYKICNILGIPDEFSLKASQFGEKYFSFENPIRILTFQEYNNNSFQKISQGKNYFSIKSIDELLLEKNVPNLQLHELFLNLIKKMLEVNPQKRISAQQAYMHPFCGGFKEDLQNLRQPLAKFSALRKQANKKNTSK